MEQILHIFVGVIAVVATGATLYTDIEDILGGAISMAAWALFGWGALNIEIIMASGGAVVKRSTAEPGVAIFAGGMAAVMLLVLLTGAATLLDPRSAQDMLPEDR